MASATGGGIRFKDDLVLSLQGKSRQDLLAYKSIRLVLACLSPATALLSPTVVILWRSDAIDLGSATQLFATVRDLYPLRGGRGLRVGCVIQLHPSGSVFPHNDIINNDNEFSSELVVDPICGKCLPGLEGRMQCSTCGGR
ncbi:hypothetical protein FOL47_004279 [Perkinsus chesapeaki]|uniref:Uncharacterized protein n=1 Tax=Perkinsus chesapeaki TaxID=330153 RepID=A0A7J6M3C4_PERCH|nr:hypothetical protein FOL47_004279 [Perkinsus chesapeaki]